MLVKVVLVFFIFARASLAIAGSAVGNGGDIFSHYIESSRSALKEVIRQLMKKPSDLESLCEMPSDLTNQQRKECRDFVAQTMKQIIELNQNEPIPAFLLRAEPLLVRGVNGKAFEVDARTHLGPTGDVEVNYPRVRFYSPFQVFTLITHEFGHKVLFNGKYLEDNQVTASFSTGRKLLDSVARALAVYAQKQGIIGNTFKLLDFYSCRIRSRLGGAVLGSSGFSSRTFNETNSFNKYETGVGYQPGSFAVYLVEQQSFGEIHFRILIHEEAGCRGQEPSRRWTDLSLFKVEPSFPGVVRKPDQLLTSQRIDGWNPVCETATPVRPMSLNWNGTEFTCVFSGSMGKASSD
jgi:hypothetical protein